MKHDLKRHKLLGILHFNTAKVNSDSLPDNEPFGVSFDILTKKMRCDIDELNTIASELYQNKEISYYDTKGIKGLCCIGNGLTSYSNNKYKSRFYKDINEKYKLYIQIIAVILSGIATFIAIESKSENTIHTKNIKQLQLKVERLENKLDFQTKATLDFQTILIIDSLNYNLKD